MSGSLLARTRVRIRVSKDCDASVNLILMPDCCSNPFSDCWKPVDWEPPKPKTISTFLSPGLLPLLPPPPLLPLLRQADAPRATAAASATRWMAFRLPIHLLLS